MSQGRADPQHLAVPGVFLCVEVAACQLYASQSAWRPSQFKYRVDAPWRRFDRKRHSRLLHNQLQRAALGAVRLQGKPRPLNLPQRRRPSEALCPLDKGIIRGIAHADQPDPLHPFSRSLRSIVISQLGVFPCELFSSSEFIFQIRVLFVKQLGRNFPKHPTPPI